MPPHAHEIIKTGVDLASADILDLARGCNRPISKSVKRDESGMRKMKTISTGFPSIEEATVHHLDIVICLGLYGGITHQDQWEADVENQQADLRCAQKFATLKLLDSILVSQPNNFILVHMLLGLGWCPQEDISLSVSARGIGSGVSLLHSPPADVDAYKSDGAGLARDGDFRHLKNDIFLVLKSLRKSLATFTEILYVLHANKRLFSQVLSGGGLSGDMWFEMGSHLNRTSFTIGASTGFCNSIHRHTSLFSYIALEIRQLSTQGTSTGVLKYLSRLLGKMVLDGQSMTNLHILHLQDFLELDTLEHIPMPKITWFNDVSLSASYQDDPFGNLSYH
ncbi:hypothetical protein HOY82DRAFT_540772 [Tuber indicum]|nr:hypothetical protein HOY82DRAFT_540772 [Tuber indicum]